MTRYFLFSNVIQLQALSEVGDGEAVQILLTTPQLSMETVEEQNVGRGYRRGGATVETAVEQRYDIDYTVDVGVGYDYDDEMNYFSDRNANTLRTLGETFNNNGFSYYYPTSNRCIIIKWALLSMFVLSIITF